jgi:hypothetical protein
LAFYLRWMPKSGLLSQIWLRLYDLASHLRVQVCEWAFGKGTAPFGCDIRILGVFE